MKCQNYLQHYRRQARVSQSELARRLGGGVSRVIVSYWETGMSAPTQEQEGLIADVLDLESKTLFPKNGFNLTNRGNDDENQR